MFSKKGAAILLIMLYTPNNAKKLSIFHALLNTGLSSFLINSLNGYFKMPCNLSNTMQV